MIPIRFTHENPSFMGLFWAEFGSIFAAGAGLRSRDQRARYENDEFRIMNDESCKRNGGFCIKNDGVCIQNDEICN